MLNELDRIEVRYVNDFESKEVRKFRITLGLRMIRVFKYNG